MSCVAVKNSERSFLQGDASSGEAVTPLAITHRFKTQMLLPGSRLTQRLGSVKTSSASCPLTDETHRAPSQCLKPDPIFTLLQPPHPLTGLTLLSVRFVHKCRPHG